MSRKLLGLDVGTVTFTPGIAGAGTLVFAGITGFNPARLMAVTNITRDAILYIPEIAAKGGAWSALSSTGGTLTLTVATTGQNAADVLRCIYQYDVADDAPPVIGLNLCPNEFVDWYVGATGVTRTNDYGPGPRAGSRSTRLQLNMTPDNAGLYSDWNSCTGRSDGATFIFSVWARITNGAAGSSQIKIEMVFADTSVAYSTVVTSTPLVDGTWRKMTCVGNCDLTNCGYLSLRIRAPYGSVADFEICDPDLRRDNAGALAPYMLSSKYKAPVRMGKLDKTSFTGWGDSLTQGVGGFTYVNELAVLLNNSQFYNGGVGGETSTQIKDRVVNPANAVFCNFGINIIWAGYNNRWYPATILADIALMVAAFPHGRFLILSCLHAQTEDSSTATYAYVKGLNEDLKRQYGSRYVDVLGPLHAGGDTIPAQYMYSDPHLNAVGHAIVASEVAKAIRRNGWFDCAPDVQTSGNAELRDLSGTITLGGTAQVLSPLRPRKYLFIQNISDTDMWINFTVPAVASQPSIKLSPGDSATFDTLVSSEVVSLYCATTGKAFTAKEG